jgi:hypothetical protein
VIADLVAEPRRLAALGHGARRHATAFSWSATAAGMTQVYREAQAAQRARREPWAAAR